MNIDRTLVGGVVAPGASMPGSSAEAALVRTNMLLAKDLDEQMRTLGRQIQLLGRAKSRCRECLARVLDFSAQNADASRKDGKRTLAADFAQMANLSSAFAEVGWNLETIELDEKPMRLSANGDKIPLAAPGRDGGPSVPVKNGALSAGELERYFSEGARIGDPAQAAESARKAGDDGGGLFFYYGHTGNRDGKGMPLFRVYAEQLDKIAERLQNRLADAEEKAEALGARLNRLSAQRKSALESVQQILAKRHASLSHILDKG